LLGSALVLVALAARDRVGIGWPWLAFNLGLAWVPLILGWIASRHRILLALVGPIWLLFLPNAPYLLTDLVHLRARPPIPLWFDVALLGGVGALGVAMGALSLRQVSGAVERELGRGPAWALMLTAPMLVGFGMYLGRFLRWNSWDLWLRPTALLRSVLAAAADPDAWGPTVVFGTLFLVAATFQARPIGLLPGSTESVGPERREP
jgi:uncharacterized membrane protein